MLLQTLRTRAIAGAAIALALMALAGPVQAGTTGSIAGTVTDGASKAPIAGAVVSAAAPSGSAKALSDAAGFYQLPNLAPDTYVVTFQKEGYESQQAGGVTVFQDQTYTLNSAIVRSTLKTIGKVTARSASNLVQPGQTADVYNLSAQQFNAAQGGDNVHKTLYNYLQSVPGITGSGAYAQPRVRGGLAPDVAYEFDGVPINDRLTGLFTTNLSNISAGSIEVYTGGYNAKYGNAAQGVFNTVIKRGTYPATGYVSYASNFTGNFGRFLSAEYGSATPDNRFSWYAGYDYSNTNNNYGNGAFAFPQVNITGFDGPGPVETKDIVANFHYKPGSRDDIQFLFQNGVGTFNFNYLLSSLAVGIVPCNGFIATGTAPSAGGISDTGLPCVDTSGTLKNGNGKSSPANPVATGLQYRSLAPDMANVWYHYSGIGKLQWNHTFNDKLYGYVRLAENFNQYIFSQPLDDPNYSGAIHNGDVALGQGNDNGAQDFYGDRRSHMYVGTAELSFAPNARSTYYGGLQYERDQNLQAYYDREGVNSGTGSAFDVNGKWPNNYLLANTPLSLQGVYAGTTQRFGKLTLEPSLRYDRMNYLIPATAGGTYSTSVWSPRFAFAYSSSPTLVFRGSYNSTSTFVPASYVFNASPDGTTGTGTNRTPYAPGANVKPPIDHNVDFSIEKGLSDGKTSLRLTTYYHKSSNKLVFLRNYTLDPVTGTPKFSGASLPTAGAKTQAFGLEAGLNHIENGPGLSWFLSGTYLNYWASSLNCGTANSGYANSTAFILSGGSLVYRAPCNPPVSATLTADYHRSRWHFLPYVIYQCCSYYNVFGSTSYPVTFGSSTKTTDTTVHTAPAYFFVNATLAYDLAKSDRGSAQLGLRVQNVFNNLKADVPPSTNVNYNKSTTIYSDAAYKFAPGSGIPNTLYYYPPVSQNPRSYEAFMTFKF